MRLNLILLLVLASFVARAQNLKPDNEKKIFVTVPPKNQAFIENRRVFISPKNSLATQYASVINRELNAEHYTIVNTADAADWTMELNIQSAVSVPFSETYETRTSKNKEGKEITTTTFTAKLTEKYTVYIDLFQKSGELIQRFTKTSEHMFQGNSPTKQGAKDAYYKDQAQERPKELDRVVKMAFSDVESEYLVANQFVFLYAMEVKSRKFDYEDMNQAAQLYTEWQATNPTDLSDPNISKVMEIYKAALTEYTPDQKKVRINDEIAAVCHYGLACIYFTTKDYATAFAEIQTSESLDKRIHHSQEALKQKCQLLKDRKVIL